MLGSNSNACPGLSKGGAPRHAMPTQHLPLSNVSSRVWKPSLREGQAPAHGHLALPALTGCSWMKPELRGAGQGTESPSITLAVGVSPPNPNGGGAAHREALSSWQVQAGGAALLCRHGLLPRPGRPFHGKSPPPAVGLASGWRGPRVVLEMVRLSLLPRQMAI